MSNISGVSKIAKGTVAGVSIITLIVAKMAGLESLHFGSFPLEIKLVAVLLPLAMVFGWYGIAGMTLGCTLAHAVNFNGYLDIFSAGIAAFLGSIISYNIFRKYNTPLGLFAGTLVITAVWTIVFGFYQVFVFQLPFSTGFLATLSSIWIAVNVIGYLAVEGIRRFVPGEYPWK